MNDLVVIEKQFVQGLLEEGIVVDDSQLQQFRSYFELLIDWNERMNLTNITDALGVYFKHFYDSITMSFVHDMKNVSSMLDIGPGAGFPSIPLKILFPELQITMVETLQKRVSFLNEVIASLELHHIEAIHGRIEDFGQDVTYRNRFDLVTARAVSRLSTLLEVSIPFLNETGYFISLKGPDVEDELKASERATVLLNAELNQRFFLELPFDLGKRTVLKYKRKGPCPKKYPRKQGQPFHKPL